MHVNLVHKLKCETNLILYPLSPTPNFRSGDILVPRFDSLPRAPKS